MENLVSGDLRIEVTSGGPAAPVLVAWTGKSNDRQPSRALEPFFAAVLATAEESKAPIEMHFERLEYFNSSTITAIIGHVQQCRSRGVPLVLVFDRTLKWQRLSFDALRVLGKGDGLLEIRAVG